MESEVDDALHLVESSRKKHRFEVIVELQASVCVITRNLKVEAPLRTTIFLCKVACPGLPSGNREQPVQNYDQTLSLVGRRWELLRACCLSSLSSSCELCSPELGLQVTWKTGQQPAPQGSGPPAFLDSNPRVFSDVACEQWLEDKITGLLPITIFSIQISFPGRKRTGNWWHLCCHRT